jgi:hypothetical protein
LKRKNWWSVLAPSRVRGTGGKSDNGHLGVDGIKAHGSKGRVASRALQLRLRDVAYHERGSALDAIP